MLRLDLEDERELSEARPDSRIDEILKPLHDHICKPTLALLDAAEDASERPVGPHYLQDFSRTPPFCSCPDHVKRGGAHDPCKHVMPSVARAAEWCVRLHVLSSATTLWRPRPTQRPRRCTWVVPTHF